MPISGVLDLQRRSLQIGELRIGTSRAIEGKKGRQPVRLDTYRVTTGSRATAEAAAEIYGGQVAPWSERKGMWEVITGRTEIQVWVPPRGEAVDSWMEAWDGPRCLARCDGIMMVRPERKPCMCPHPDNPADPASVEAARAERMRLAAMRPPQACKPMTRYNVSITELPGALGVFKLVTGSEAAAVESADSGDALALARQRGIYLPAIARISWRTRIGDGKPYPVPVLQIGASLEEIARGELPAGPAGLLAALAPSHAPAAAIGSGQDRRALPPGDPEAATTTTTTTTTTVPTAAGVPSPAEPDVTGDAYLEPWQKATRIYNRALAATSGAEIEACFRDAETQGLAEESVRTDKVNDAWEDLHTALQAVYLAKGKGAA
jgi:hypothetical protein